jgi:hypothetical protein
MVNNLGCILRKQTAPTANLKGLLASLVDQIPLVSIEIECTAIAVGFEPSLGLPDGFTFAIEDMGLNAVLKLELGRTEAAFEIGRCWLLGG